MKPRYKRRIFWTVFFVIVTLALAAVIIPPFVNYNKLKPYFENSILTQTGISAKIQGDINISLLGRATVIAHDVEVKNGKINSVLFAIPTSKIFNIQAATLRGKIAVDGAKLDIQKLTAPKIEREISITDSVISFMGKDYKIVTGTLDNGNFNGTVRTSQHKYFIESGKDGFNITNKNEGLAISGVLLPSGGADAFLSIETDDINSWFDFSEPKITGRVKLETKIAWDGKYGFVFSDINGTRNGNAFTGFIELSDAEKNTVRFAADNINFDLSFLLSQKSLLKNSNLDLDLSGDLKFMEQIFNRVKLSATEEDGKLIIGNLEFENAEINGSLNGVITATGAENLALRFTKNGANVYCLFSGTPADWQCADYSYADASLSARGELFVNKNEFHGTLISENPMPENFDFANKLKFLGDNGRIDFKFANASGTIEISNKEQKISYDFINEKSLADLGVDYSFFPTAMKSQLGTFQRTDDMENCRYQRGISFEPDNKRWKLDTCENNFNLSGKSAKEFLTAFFPGLELPFANDYEFSASGKIGKNSIADLKIEIAGQTFIGNVSDNNITLKTDTLNLDAFANAKYFENYEDMQFLSGAPILAPFAMGDANISISASRVIFGSESYDNFIYSLKPGVQDFSITDDARGNILVSIRKNQADYDIILQLNKFAFNGPFLDYKFPLNISDSVITGQGKLKTSGKISYDFWSNMQGDLELNFDGGILTGIGTDYLYSQLPNITRTNIEDMLAAAASGGATQIKSAQIIGKYDGGKFQTSQPLRIVVRNAEIIGNMQLSSGKMATNLNIFLRGLSAEPKPISLTINESGQKSYSLSQIMAVFDPEIIANNL